jgi:type IX secretion system PorP/SprF family membrane protein
MRDQQGPQNNLEIQASYAYHLGIKDSKLSFGIRLGAFVQTLDYDKYRYIEDGDPFLDGKEGKDSQMKPDMAFGVFYRSEKFYGGIGFNHLLKSEFDFGIPSQRNALENHLYITGGYIHEVSFDLKMTPTFLVKTDLNEFSVELGVIGTYKDTMWGGLSFRESDAVILLFGYSFLKDKSLRLGYAIDLTIKDKCAKALTSNEFMLSYELPVNPGSGKKVVRTPRYRH